MSFSLIMCLDPNIKYLIPFQSDNESKECEGFEPNYITVNNVLLA